MLTCHSLRNAQTVGAIRPPRATQRAQQRAFDTFPFGRRPLFLATPLEGYDVGLDEVEDGIWSIYFCNVLIARFDERDHVIRS